jgi:ATP-dependent DNA ligase
MHLPIAENYKPMEAEPAAGLPHGPNWSYEPKWDGFRCIAFRDAQEVVLQSKSQKSLSRYFPEVTTALQALDSEKFVLDGEIVIPINGDLSFDDLLARIHPAASRIDKLSQATPAVYLVFDLLADENGKSLVLLPLHERRVRLEKFAARFLDDKSIRLSPSTSDLQIARKWFHAGTGLDGIMAKREDAPYASGERTAMLKIKKQRTADCVVGGFRYLEKKREVGSLLLGLYNSRNLLDHVGYTSSIHEEDRAKLTKKLEKLISAPGFTGKAPGGLSRWSTKKSAEWQPLKTKLVVEVQFDHFTGGRFRHGTKFIRWRPEKDPKSCLMKQVKRENKSALDLLETKEYPLRVTEVTGRGLLDKQL